MSDNTTLMKHLGLSRPGVPPVPADDEESSCSAFGYLRGVRDRALHLELKLEAGDSITLPYAWLGPTRFHPSLGIALLFQGADLFLVKLVGRNVNLPRAEGISLYDLLLRHRAVWVRESSAIESAALPERECVLDRIECRLVTPEEAATTLRFD
jgi:hypothetical protein